jgi:Ca2+:H+ antiporter
LNEQAIKPFTIAMPIIALLLLAVVVIGGFASVVISTIMFVLLITCVMFSVYHAEIIAHYLGHTLGALVLALSVTILEVGLILAFMISGVADSESIARDTIFSAVMIVCNGVVGLAIVVGGLKYQKQYFRVQGTNSIMVVLVALSFFTLVLPSFTTSTPGPFYNNIQLGFAAISSVVVYIIFVYSQTVLNKKDFEAKRLKSDKEIEQDFLNPTKREAWISFWALLISLIAVIAVAKFLAPTIESVLAGFGAPKQFVGIVMACIILLPETLAAVRAALNNKLQVTLNLALGSGAASIALTIPCVAAYSIFSNTPLELGINQKDLIFLILTFLISSFSLGTGKATLLQGSIHIFVLLFYLLLTFTP